ncbi:MAG: hypothetical protein ACOYL3_21725 [Desulfuromonadaceae bacterium]
MKQSNLKLCGHLQGNFSELLPCVFIHHIGVKLRVFSHDKELKTGIFCMRKNNDYLIYGVILPPDFDSKSWYGHDSVPEDGHIGEMILVDLWFNA